MGCTRPQPGSARGLHALLALSGHRVMATLEGFLMPKQLTKTLERVTVRRVSALELEMLRQIQAAQLPTPKLEHRFHPVRRWRFDFCWIDQRLALEVEGGIWCNGRHTTGSGFTADCAKYNTALIMGWRVLRVTGTQVKSGAALSWLELALKVGS